MLTIKSAEIENYRSIIGPPLTVNLDQLTVIVGPNNCGKSNILRALELFLGVKLRGVLTTRTWISPKQVFCLAPLKQKSL